MRTVIKIIMDSSTEATEEKLKQASGEFCLESIYILDFSGKGIYLLGSIPQCLNLCILNLSSNNLSAVGELGGLTSLEHLDLSDNNISGLGELNKLENLTRLELAGNKIPSIDSLLPLSSLCELKYLTLQLLHSTSDRSSTQHLTNPVCQDISTYNAGMAEMFPGLVWLDGEVIKEDVAGNEFFRECRAIQARSENKQYLDVENTQHNQKLAVVLQDPLANEDEDDRKIEHLLDECSKTSKQIQKHIKEVRNELEANSTGAL